MRQIKVDIGPDGAVTIDAVGFRGSDCEEATRFLEDALGDVGERRRKPGYRQASARYCTRVQSQKGKA